MQFSSPEDTGEASSATERAFRCVENSLAMNQAYPWRWRHLLQQHPHGSPALFNLVLLDRLSSSGQRIAIEAFLDRFPPSSTFDRFATRVAAHLCGNNISKSTGTLLLDSEISIDFPESCPRLSMLALWQLSSFVAQSSLPSRAICSVQPSAAAPVCTRQQLGRLLSLAIEAKTDTTAPGSPPRSPPMNRRITDAHAGANHATVQRTDTTDVGRSAGVQISVPLQQALLAFAAELRALPEYSSFLEDQTTEDLRWRPKERVSINAAWVVQAGLFAEQVTAALQDDSREIFDEVVGLIEAARRAPPVPAVKMTESIFQDASYSPVAPTLADILGDPGDSVRYLSRARALAKLCELDLLFLEPVRFTELSVPHLEFRVVENFRASPDNDEDRLGTDDVIATELIRAFTSAAIAAGVLRNGWLESKDVTQIVTVVAQDASVSLSRVWTVLWHCIAGRFAFEIKSANMKSVQSDSQHERFTDMLARELLAFDLDSEDADRDLQPEAEFLEYVRSCTTDQLSNTPATMQQIWDALERIEKRQEQHPSKRTANQWSLDTGRLVRLKTALIPLLAQLASHQPVGDGSASLDDHDPGVTEIAYFDTSGHAREGDEFQLLLRRSNWENMLQVSRSRTISNCVAICGDTHVGKSTLINALLGELGRQSAKESFKSEINHYDDDELSAFSRFHGAFAPVARANQNAPTTSNVRYFDSMPFSTSASDQSSSPSVSHVAAGASVGDLVSNIRFLDLEGENGGKLPTTLHSRIVMRLATLFGIERYQERRRRAVSKTMPRLAYVCSEIVMFVSNNSFANAEYLERVHQLCLDAVDHVDSATAPSLVLVFNKSDLDEEFDIEQNTARFFENSENEALRGFYSSVHCIAIPHIDHVKKVRARGKKTLMIDGEEIFALQICKLANLIRSILTDRLSQREMHGTVFSERVWTLLFRKVVSMMQHNSIGSGESSEIDEGTGEQTDDNRNAAPRLRMAELLCSIVKPQHNLALRAFDFFRETYLALWNRFRAVERQLRSFYERKLRPFDYSYVSRKFLFQHASNAAVVFLAFLFVDHAQRMQAELRDKWVIHNLRSAGFRKELSDAFCELKSHMRNLEPCDALLFLPSKGANEPPATACGKTFVRCGLEYMCHGEFHRGNLADSFTLRPAEEAFFERFELCGSNLESVLGLLRSGNHNIPGALGNMWLQAQRWLGIGYRTWPGTHPSSLPTREANVFDAVENSNSEPGPLSPLMAQEFATFCSLVNGSCRINSANTYFLTRVGILQRAVALGDLLHQKKVCEAQKLQLGATSFTPVTSFVSCIVQNSCSRTCWICCSMFPDLTLYPCRHRFCSACWVALQMCTSDTENCGASLDDVVLSGGGNIEVEAESVSSFFSLPEPLTLRDSCPICQAQVSSTSSAVPDSAKQRADDESSSVLVEKLFGLTTTQQ